ARSGVRFTRAYANAPVCSPTRAALMTGRYPHRLGIEYVFRPATPGKGLLPSETTVARLLRDAGYRTALSGKWHLGAEDEFSPLKHGFEEFFGFRGSDHDYYSHRTLEGKPDLYENDRLVERTGYSTDLFGAWAADYIRRQRKGGPPFFLYAAFNAPHWPFQPPGKPEDVRTPETWMAGTRGDYVRMVERLDENVGRLLGALRESGLEENALVIFTNDNGGDRLSDNGGAFHHKFTVWEGGIRVPLLMRWPGVIERRGDCGQVAITMDLTATALRAAGAAPRADRPLDGMDLTGAASGRDRDVERTIFWRHRNQMRAARRGDWKLVRDSGYDLLFDLARDPGERRDLAFEQPQKVEELRGLLEAWEKEMAASNPAWRVV
ncbi:MAG TPA: twin-arginine translocation pathway signal protein, partial [Solibacterales bacterium]|nr:twin-arginine translocation pathway signal protein [Bryobacterales bacterium]